MSYFLSIFLGTFILEDVAIASSLVLMAENKMNFMQAFMACFLGISIGDLGLYFLGYLISQFRFDKRFSFLKKYQVQLKQNKNSEILSFSIIISRFIPGTRLPTYLTAGFVGYSLLWFSILTIGSVFTWVLFVFLGGKSLLYIFKDHWILLILSFFIFINILKSLIINLSDPWARKTLLYSWRKWLHFEFWPAIIFYIPIVPFYIYFSFKYKNPFMPFYANPNLEHGGLIGESKWELLRHLAPTESTTLNTILLDKSIDFESAKLLIEKEHFTYPFILKPDIGQRGFAVRIIRSETELQEYLKLSTFDRIIQRLSNLPKEAGLFYVRKPSENIGTLFSITDKEFPFVVGDGSTKLGDLILKDKRARIIAPVYFTRLQDQLNSIVQKNEAILLSECGNHCQGAIFKNGETLITKELTLALDKIAKQIPDFYFGRFDIRYQDHQLLMQGQEFEIVEINASGAEATHIWDTNTKLLDAYKTLFIQWGFLFEIGAQVCRLPNKKRKLAFAAFLKETLKVALRKDKLSVSS